MAGTTTTSVQTPQETVAEVFARWEAEEIPAWRDGRYTPGEDQFAEMAAEAIELDRATRNQNVLSRAIEELRSLNSLEVGDTTVENPEYLRGQVEILASVFGDGSYELADTIFATLGIERL